MRVISVSCPKCDTFPLPKHSNVFQRVHFDIWPLPIHLCNGWLSELSGLWHAASTLILSFLFLTPEHKCSLSGHNLSKRVFCCFFIFFLTSSVCLSCFACICSTKVIKMYNNIQPGQLINHLCTNNISTSLWLKNRKKPLQIVMQPSNLHLPTGSQMKPQEDYVLKNL